MQRHRCGIESQHFEEFLASAPTDEYFGDIEWFVGFSTLEFIRRAPRFNCASTFERSMTDHAVVMANPPLLAAERPIDHQCRFRVASGAVNFIPELTDEAGVDCELQTLSYTAGIDETTLVLQPVSGTCG